MCLLLGVNIAAGMTLWYLSLKPKVLKEEGETTLHFTSTYLLAREPKSANRNDSRLTTVIKIFEAPLMLLEQLLERIWKPDFLNEQQNQRVLSIIVSTLWAMPCHRYISRYFFILQRSHQRINVAVFNIFLYDRFCCGTFILVSIKGYCLQLPEEA